MNEMVSYFYDAWGKLTCIGGSLASTVGALNPFRYRGYYYDTETGLYLLQSRYYDPNTGRFLNADGMVSTGTGLLGHNMFAYCNNNPNMMSDPDGTILYNDDGIRTTPTLLTEARAILKAASAANSLNNNTSIPSGRTSVYKGPIRICTDGSVGPDKVDPKVGVKIPDDNWNKKTATQHNGNYLDAYTVPYVVLPAFPKNNTGYKTGCSSLLINHDTGKSVRCIGGEVSPATNGWGEVSIAAIWDTGNPEHKTAKNSSGLSSNYEIIMYPGEPYNWGN